MKATGIVRRIDDLGRVVIPKEIRRTQLIRVGDPLEIYVSGNNEVIFKKYSPMGELLTLAQNYTEILAKHIGILTVVADRDHIIATCAPLRDMLEKRITKSYESIVEIRKTSAQEMPQVICDGNTHTAKAVAPVICHGDIIGSVAFISTNKDIANPHYNSEIDIGTATAHIHVAAQIMGKQMEE